MTRFHTVVPFRFALIRERFKFTAGTRFRGLRFEMNFAFDLCTARYANTVLFEGTDSTNREAVWRNGCLVSYALGDRERVVAN